MSIVAVHGPHTFGSAAVFNSNKSFEAFAISSDDSKWRFVPVDKSQPAANYDWAWAHTSGTAGGSPASPVNDTMIAEFTFPLAATPSTKTITLTLNGVAQPALVITIPATTAQGVSPMSMPGGDGEEGEESFSRQAEEDPEIDVAFDPAAHTVTEVIGFVEDYPETLEDVIAAEEAGKNRVTLISHLESMRPS